MITREQIPQVVGHPVHDTQGKKIGDAKHMYLDDATGLPEWVTVKTGFFGNNETFVPTRAAKIVQDHVEVPYEKDKVKGVDVDAGGHLSAEEERHLYRYYGLETRGGSPDSADKASGTAGTGEKAAAAGGAAGMAGAAGRGRHARRDSADTADSGAAAAKGTDTEMSGSEAGTGTAAYAAGRTGAAERLGAGDMDESVTRSEEEMHVRVERQTTGRARLHKYVDVEEVEETVPIRREEVRLVREPITEADGTRAGDISEAEREVTLHEDKAVIETEVVPKERVRMRVEEHTEQQTVHGRVRRERIETDMAGEPGTERATKSTDEEGNR
jgi:stress response protein YsnF